MEDRIKRQKRKDLKEKERYDAIRNSEWYQNYLKKKSEGPYKHLNPDCTNSYKESRRIKSISYLYYKSK